MATLVYELNYISPHYRYQDWVQGTMQHNKVFRDRLSWEPKYGDPLIEYHKVKTISILIHTEFTSVEGLKWKMLSKYFDTINGYKFKYESDFTKSEQIARKIYGKMFGIDPNLIGTIFGVRTPIMI